MVRINISGPGSREALFVAGGAVALMLALALSFVVRASGSAPAPAEGEPASQASPVTSAQATKPAKESMGAKEAAGGANHTLGGYRVGSAPKGTVTDAELVEAAFKAYGDFGSVVCESATKNSDGSWTVTATVDGKPTVLCVPAPTQPDFGEDTGTATATEVSLGDAVALSSLLGPECAEALAGKWDEYATSAGLLPRTEVTVPSRSVSMDGDSVTFEVESPKATSGAWSPDVTSCTWDGKALSFERSE